MASVLEHATLSQHIYKPHQPLFGSQQFILKKHFAITPQLEGWKKLEDFDSNIQPNKHIYAGLYLNFNHGHALDAVVAIRGTDNIFNDFVDMVSWYQNVMGTDRHSLLPAYTNDIMHFFIQCERLLKAAGLAHIYPTITGHSLGGALAQLYNLRYLQTTAITFNSPGCAQMPGIHLDRSHLVHEFSARWGIINRIGKPVSPPTWIEIPEDAAVAEKLVHHWNERLNQAGTQLEDKAFAKSKDSLLSTLEPSGPLSLQIAGTLLKVADIEDTAEKAGGNEAAYHAIKEQHKIANMVRALQQSSYRTIAQQSFTL